MHNLGHHLATAQAGFPQAPFLSISVLDQIGDTAQFNQRKVEMAAHSSDSRPFHILTQAIIPPGETVSPFSGPTDTVDSDKGASMEGNAQPLKQGVV